LDSLVDFNPGDLLWVMDDLHGLPITFRFDKCDFRLATGEWYVSGTGADRQPVSVPARNVIAVVTRREIEKG
jgi:hypothetical protein